METVTVMILMIDNYDSFTYNLVQYFGELGETLSIHRNDTITMEDIDKLKPDQIVISPGPCTPKEAGVSINVIKRFAGETPILGVCLGHQSIGAAFGASIVRAQKLMHGKTSMISHDGSTLFRDINNPFEATRYHSLVIEKSSCPDCFEVSAFSDDDGEIMGIRHKDFPSKRCLEGVQFHPESILTSTGKDILRNFIDMTTT